MGKLDAYYYGFESTGNKEIDSILESVAAAGKSFHNTEDWTDSNEWLNDGVSVSDMIQKAANEAATSIRKQIDNSYRQGCHDQKLVDKTTGKDKL